MEQKEANDIITSQPTPAGQKITTDTVFDLFASLVPNSPWAKRLLKIKTVFNHLATGATLITTVPGWSLGDQVYDVREREGEGWNGPAVTQFAQGNTELCAGLQMMGAEPVQSPGELPELDEPIDWRKIATESGANFEHGEANGSVLFGEVEMTRFLAEYRRQLIEGE